MSTLLNAQINHVRIGLNDLLRLMDALRTDKGDTYTSGQTAHWYIIRSCCLAIGDLLDVINQRAGDL
jgi:hypothetical protein